MAFAFEQITTLNVVQSLTVPAGGAKAIVQADGGSDVRMRLDSTDPTGTVGTVLVDGGDWFTIPAEGLVGARFIRDGGAGTPVLNVQYLLSDAP